MFYFWVISKYMQTWRRFFDVTVLLTLLGIIIGVAVMIVAMASFSGFQETLQQALIEVIGDVSIYKQGGKIDNIEALEKEVEPYMGDAEGAMRFLSQESLFASKGKISAVLVQGVDKETAYKVLNMEGRKVSGQISWALKDEIPAAFIGKDLLAKMNLKVGDTFRIV
ncbi:MAG: ABC transporter permease, partial [Bdellovibrionales bacterium]|nr:ABC transporter permease [Bdellovibrionales bacterium]